MRVSCLFCNGWVEYRGLRTVDGEHDADCSKNAQAWRQRMIAETGRDPLSTSASMVTPFAMSEER